MLASKLCSPTLREIPADAEIASHQYMLKAGMIRKNGGGLYSFLPLGRRVELKIEAIVREEMENIGAQEIMMPIMQPAEIWHESGRWNAYGPEMFKLEDRHGNHFCLGPTHEELITTLVRNELRSYKQMPVTLWQMQNKYRDEIRPRFGLMRSREFVMKDAYSFDVDEEGLHKSYQDEYEAYTRIFTRCGLNFKPVEADSGQIGGNHTHEFMALAQAGEAEIVSCSKCDYAADIEKAVPQAIEMPAEDAKDVELIETPNCSTIEDLAQFLHIPGENLLGVYSANELLTRVNLMKAYRDDYDTPIKHFHNVCVVGAGNVAMDAARVSKRLGAEHVYIAYRRGKDELPARKEEVEHAEAEGIEFRLLNNPVAIHAGEDGHVTGIELQKQELGEPDEKGRRKPVPVEGSNWILDVDTVVIAIGTSPNPLIRNTTKGLTFTRKGGIEADEGGATAREGVFAGGDAVTGAATVILAMGAGKAGAKSIDEYIKSKK